MAINITPSAKQSVATPLKDENESNAGNSAPKQPVEDNGEYIYNRTVTILPVRAYSLYRKANDKYLPKQRDCIGSSVSSSRALSSNKNEIEAYFPNLIGLAVNNPDFVTRVKGWLNNITVAVDERGVVLNNSFRFTHKSDYYVIKSKFDKIEEKYERDKVGSLENLKRALDIKISDLNALESSLYQYGSPVNIEEYLIYRHCLLYKHIAKDNALINTDPNVRFYFKDDVKEIEQKNKLRIELNKAKVNYVNVISNNKLFDAVYTMYCATRGINIIANSNLSLTERQNNLDDYSRTEPAKFNKIVEDKDVELKAMIETLIARGELQRSAYNQNITSAEGSLIGSNLKEAVAWFKDPANTGAVTAYANKLANI